MKTKAKTPKKTGRKAAVTSRAYPELRCRIDEWHGKYFPMVQVNFIQWLYINYDALHESHQVVNSHPGCKTPQEAMEYIDRYKTFMQSKDGVTKSTYV